MFLFKHISTNSSKVKLFCVANKYRFSSRGRVLILSVLYLNSLTFTEALRKCFIYTLLKALQNNKYSDLGDFMFCTKILTKNITDNSVQNLLKRVHIMKLSNFVVYFSIYTQQTSQNFLKIFEFQKQKVLCPEKKVQSRIIYDCHSS